MSPCPPDARLHQLLDGQLPSEDVAAIEHHVEGCESCQGWLEMFTNEPLPGPIRPSPADDPVSVGPLASTFMLRVRDAARLPSRPVGPPQVPGYKLEGELGRGGIGVVYRAVDTQLNRPAAVKMLRDARFADDETRVRFMIEAEAVARLRHSGIVQLYEFGEADGLPFLAMELVTGGTLADRLVAGETFTPHAAAGVLLDLAAAVAAAHRAGVIHRDLKPANVLVADGRESGGEGASGLCLKVADFGLARLDGGGETATGAVMGTPSYMSPEQAAGRAREVTTATDVYALGAILYELLGGRPPFTGDTALEVLQRVIHTDPPSFHALGRRVPRDLEVICRKCLAKDPARRYPTADALAADLRAFRDGRPITARAMPLWERGVRVVARHPLPTLAVVVVLAAVLAAFLGVNDAREQERKARGQADDRAKVAQQAQADEAEARRTAERRQAENAFDRAGLRCESGDVAGGVIDMDAAANLAEAAGDAGLARVFRASAAAWRARLPVFVRRYDAPAGTRILTAVAFADGGRQVVLAGGGDGAVHVLPTTPDPAHPAQRFVLERPLLGAPNPVGLIPEKNGQMLVGFQSGPVRRFDPLTGKSDPRAVTADLFSHLRDFATSPDGRWVAYTTIGGIVRVNETATGKPLVPELIHRPTRVTAEGLKTDPNKPANEVTAVAFADDGRFLLAAARSGGVLMWSLPDGALLHQFDLGADAFRLAVGGHGQFFMTGGETATSLWSIHYRDRPLWVHPHPQRVGAVVFSPDGRTCATADHGGNVACLDRATGRVLARWRVDEPVRALAFHPSEPLLLVGCESGAAELWRLPKSDVIDIASPSPPNNRPWSTVPVGAESGRAITAVGFWPGGRDVWSLTPTGLDRWVGGRWNQKEITNLLPGVNDGRGLRTAAMNATGTLAVTGGWEGPRTGVYDLTASPPTFHHLTDAGSPFAVGFLSDGHTFFTLTETKQLTGRLLFWEWRDGRARALPPTKQVELDTRTVAPTSDGRRALVGLTAGHPSGVRDLMTGELIRELSQSGTVTAAAVHPSGEWAATGGRDGSVRVWQVADGQAIGRVMFHADRVTQVAFGTGDLDGCLITASLDRTVRVWHVRTGLPVGPPLRHPEAVLALAVAPDGRVLTGGKDGILREWQPKVGTTLSH